MRRPAVIFLAAAGAVVLTLLLAACGSADEQAAREGPAGAAAPAPLADSDKLAVAGDGSGAGMPLLDVTGRKITRTATLDLSVQDISAAVRDITRIVRDAGGFISESDVVAPRDGNNQTATITVRVPAGSFEDVMDQFRDVATDVESETSKATEVTEEYTDLQARLRNLQAAEARYLELFAKAEAIPDILSIQEKVDSVRLEIEQVQGRINVLNDLTDLATINIALSLVPAEGSGDGHGWALEALETSWEASKDAGVVLGTVAIAGAVLLAWLIPLSLLGAAGWRLFGKRLVVLARKIYEA